jgi:hypothetical protein
MILTTAAALLTLSLTLPAIAQTPTPTPPTVPFDSKGVCPFECCTYRTWTVRTDTDILVDRTPGAPVAFRVHRGERVEGVTGVVVTTTLGRAVVRRAVTLGVESGPIAVQPGDAVYILHYSGEGYWTFWAHGRIDADQIPGKDEGCVDDAGESISCAVQIIEAPRTTWWAKIRSGGKEGWTSHLDHFGEIDACS